MSGAFEYLFPGQGIGQVGLADVVAGEVFVGILVVTPDVLADPAVALDSTGVGTPLIQFQWNIILTSHVADQGHVSLVVRPEFGRAMGVAELNLDGRVLVGGRTGAPGHGSRPLHLVDRPAIADHKVRVGLATVGRPLHVAGRLLSVGPATNIMEDNVLRRSRLIGPLPTAKLILVADLIGQNLFAILPEAVGHPIDLPGSGHLMTALDKGPVTAIIIPAIVQIEVTLEGSR